MHFLGILSINYLEFRPYTAAAAISRNWGIGQIYAAAIMTMTRTLIILIIRVVKFHSARGRPLLGP